MKFIYLFLVVLMIGLVSASSYDDCNVYGNCNLVSSTTSINQSTLNVNFSETTNCWSTTEGIKCDVSDITYDEISGGDINDLGYYGYFNGLGGVVGGLSMDGDPWYLGGTDLEIDLDLQVNNSYIEHDLMPTDTLNGNIGSGALRWLWLYVQNISAEEIDAYNLHLFENLTIDGSINGVNISSLSNDYVPYNDANKGIDLNGKNITNASSFNDVFWNFTTDATTTFWNIFLGEADGSEVEVEIIDWDNVNFTNVNNICYSNGTGCIISSSNPFIEDIVINKLIENTPINIIFNFTDGSSANITYTSDNVFGFVGANAYAFDNDVYVDTLCNSTGSCFSLSDLNITSGNSSWNQSHAVEVFNNKYLNLSGGNANQNINIDEFNLSLGYLSVEDGEKENPSINFKDKTDTGIYREVETAYPYNKLMGFTTDGNEMLKLYGDGIDGFQSVWNTGSKYIYSSDFTNYLYRSDRRFGVSTTGFSSSNTALLFDGQYESWSSNKVLAGTTAQIKINLTEKGFYGSSGTTYALGGKLILAMYGGTGAGLDNLELKLRTRDKNGVWREFNNAKKLNSGDKSIYAFTIGGYAYITDIEINITAGASSMQYGLVEVEHWANRISGDDKLSGFTKYSTEDLYYPWTWYDSNYDSQTSIGTFGVSTNGTYSNKGNEGLTGNYSNGNCWKAYSGGILYSTNCTEV